jgi:hypothetical protein
VLSSFFKLYFVFLIFLFFQSFSQEVNKKTKQKIPVSLGSGVNSTAGELYPVISADGKTLYFVRDGHEKNLAKKRCLV